MYKLVIPPDQNGYSLTDSDGTINAKLAGGFLKVRSDLINTAKIVSVQWTVDKTTYTHLRTFFETLLHNEVDPFLIDLFVNDGSQPIEHVARVVPGSRSLQGVRGLTFTLACTLEVRPNAVPASEQTLAIWYVGFSPDFDRQEDLFNTAINVKLPGVHA